MSESLKNKATRHAFNLMPVIRNSGGRITYLADDHQELRMSMKLNRKTRNYVGTIYGGCLYSSIDGIYMVMFLRILGKEYIVWDQAASIEYKKPGKGRIQAIFKITDEQIAEVKQALETERSIRRSYPIEWIDEAGDVVCSIEKNLYFRKKKQD